uniref:Uncharacterized protein n=1 Tax=Hyaloperonospora arabidopsidis (strain Emoy2) TaxID=559515 RepID=M4C0C8_HYAAE
MTFFRVPSFRPISGSTGTVTVFQDHLPMFRLGPPGGTTALSKINSADMWRSQCRA